MATETNDSEVYETEFKRDQTAISIPSPSGNVMEADDDEIIDIICVHPLDPRLKYKLCVFGYIRENFKEFEYIIPSEIFPIIILFADNPLNITWKITPDLIKQCNYLLSPNKYTSLYSPQSSSTYYLSSDTSCPESSDTDDGSHSTQVTHRTQKQTKQQHQQQQRPVRILGPAITITFHGHSFKYQVHLMKAPQDKGLKIGLIRYLIANDEEQKQQKQQNNKNKNDDPREAPYKEFKFWLEQYRVYKSTKDINGKLVPKWHKIAGLEGHNRNTDSYWLPQICMDELKTMKEIIFNFEPLKLTMCSQLDFIKSKLLNLETNAIYYHRKDLYIKSRNYYKWIIDEATLELMKRTDDGKIYKFASKNFDIVHENWYLCIKPRENGEVQIGLRLVKKPYNIYMIDCIVEFKVDGITDGRCYQEFTVLKSSGWLWRPFGKTERFFFDGRKSLQIECDIKIRNVWRGVHCCSEKLPKSEWRKYHVISDDDEPTSIKKEEEEQYHLMNMRDNMEDNTGSDHSDYSKEEEEWPEPFEF